MNEDLVWRGNPYKKKNWRILRIQYYISPILDKFPRLKKVMIALLYNIKISRYRLKSKKLLKNKDVDLDVDKTFLIDPKKIKYISSKEFDVEEYKGMIIDGDWDLLDRKFKELDVYVAFKERFIESKKWEQTVYYKRVMNVLNEGKVLWNCKNLDDFDYRIKKLDLLYEEIKKNGYKSQIELQSDKNVESNKIDDEVAINIGRNGDFLFNNGAHRLSIAKILNIPKIPVKITVRHPQWIDLRKQILLYAKDESSGKIYQPISHIDLHDIPSFHETEISRFEIIQKNLSSKNGRLLDIGSNWGYFCHKFEEIGFECYAIENSPVNIYFLEKLKRADNKKFTIVPISIFEYEELNNIDFDVVLALNIFHHFLKQKDTYFKLINLLLKLRVKEMYFQPHLPEEFRVSSVYKNFSEEEFVNFIIDNSNLKQARCIGKAQDGRKIYKIF